MIAVIHEHIDPGLREIAVEGIGDRHDFLIGDIQGDDLDSVGGDVDRPDDAIVIVAGFDDGGDDACDPDPVAAHDDGVRLFLGIDEAGIHGRAVLGSQFEDVTDFDAVDHLERPGAFGAGVAGFGISKVEGGGDFEMCSRDDLREVGIFLIGADDSGADLSDIMINVEGAEETDGSGEAGGCPGHFQNGGFVGQFDGGGLCDAADLAFVGGVVTAEEDRHGLAIGLVDQSFDEGRRLGFEEPADLFDAAGVGRGHEHRGGSGIDGFWQRGGATGFCAFLIRGVTAGCAVDDEVFAIAGGNHEFVGGITADGPAFGFDGQVTQTAAFEDAAVGVIHGVVGGVELFERRAEAVGILHQEFAGAKNTEAGAFFVAKLGLNLIEGDGQLTIAADVSGHQVGDDFFVGWAECEVEFAVTTFDFEIEEHISEGVFTTGAFEDFDGLQGGHEQFDCASAIHFLANNFRDFADRAIAEGQVGVGACHQLSNQSGAQHQLMAGDFGFGGDFLHGRNERLRPAHREPEFQRDEETVKFKREAGV